MGSVDLKHVEPAPGGAGGGLTPVGNQRTHLGEGQLARRWCRLGMGHGARCNQLPIVPVVHSGLAPGKRCAALPRPRQTRLAPRMPKLDAGEGTLCPDEGRTARERRNEFVVPQSGIADRTAAVTRHLGRFHDDEASTALGVATGVDEMPVGRMARNRRILMHRRDDDAVFEHRAANGQRREQQRLVHLGRVPGQRCRCGLHFLLHPTPRREPASSATCGRGQRRAAAGLGCAPLPIGRA